MFRILPISETNPDRDISDFIQSKGIEFFLKYQNEIINNGSENDKIYFQSYLYTYLFETSWDSFLKAVSLNKKAIDLIDHILGEKSKKLFVKYIIKYYKEEDIDKIIFSDKLLPYLNVKETNVLNIMLASKRLKLKPFLKCKTTREDTLNWLNDYYKNNLRFKSLVSINVLDIHNLDKKFIELINITEQMLDIFKIGISDDKIKSFKLPETQNYYEDATLKFINKYFFMLHDYIELSILNLIECKKFLHSSLNEMNDEIAEMEFDDERRDILSLKLQFFTSLETKLNTINFNEEKTMHFYRHTTVSWLTTLYEGSLKSGHPLIDNIALNVIEFLSNTLFILYFDEPLFNILSSIIDHKNPITKSKSLQCKCIMLLSLNFNSIQTGVKYRILGKLDTFVENCVNLFVNISDINEYDIYMYQQEILFMLSPYKEIIFEVMDECIIQKFIYHLFENYSSFYKGYINNIEILYKIKNNLPLSDETYNSDKIKPSLLWYQHEIFKMDQFISMSKFLDRAIKIGNKEKLALVMGFKLKSLCGENRNMLNIREDKYTFDPITHLMNIFIVFNHFCENEIFKKTISNESYYFKTEYLEKMLNVLIKKEKIQHNEYENIMKFTSSLQNVQLIDDENIPEDLLDPIMGTLIETPVLLPNSNTFMEKDVIMRHLLTSDNNPFTRDPLTSSQLEEFNKRDDVQERLSLFKQRLLDKR